MSAIARSTLRDTIRKSGGYENVRKFNNDFLNTKIQSAFAKFWQLVAKEHKGYWDTDSTVATVANQAYVALPATCWTIQAIDLLDSNGKVTQRLAQVGIDARTRYEDTGSEPCAYRRSARGVELYPPPSAVLTLKVYYTPFAPTLDEDTTREWYNGWEELVVEYVLLELDKREGKPLADRLETIKMMETQVKDGVEQSNQQEPEYLVLREFFDDGEF
jgi:hypothetical protein